MMKLTKEQVAKRRARRLLRTSEEIVALNMEAFIAYSTLALELLYQGEEKVARINMAEPKRSIEHFTGPRVSITKVEVSR